MLNSISKIKFNSILYRTGNLINSNGTKLESKENAIFSVLFSSQQRNISINNSKHIYDRLVRGASTIRSNSNRFTRTYETDYHLLKTAFTETGAVGPLPKWYRLGIIKIVANIILFLFIGSYITKTFVKILEENDIFKPEDDDDDDDD